MLNSCRELATDSSWQKQTAPFWAALGSGAFSWHALPRSVRSFLHGFPCSTRLGSQLRPGELQCEAENFVGLILYFSGFGFLSVRLGRVLRKNEVLNPVKKYCRKSLNNILLKERTSKFFWSLQSNNKKPLQYIHWGLPIAINSVLPPPLTPP